MLVFHGHAEENLALLETMFENSPVGFSFVDTQFRFVRWNAALAAIDGRAVHEYAGKSVPEIVPHLWPSLEPLFKRVLAGETILNQRVSGVASAADAQLRHWLVSYYPVRIQEEIIGISVIVNDISESKRYEDALCVRNDLYAMLSRMNRAVSRCQSREELYRDVCTIAVETGRFKFAWIGIPEANRVKMVAACGNDGGYMDQLVITLDENDPRSYGPTGRAALTGESYVVNDFMASMMTSPWHEQAQQVGFAASAAFPLTERGKVVAVLTLYAAVRDFFTDDLVATLSEIRPSLSFALDRFVEEQDRIQAEEALRLRDRAMQALSQGIVITDPRKFDNPIVYVSPSFELMTGYSAAEAIGKNCRFLQGEETDPAAIAQISNAIREQSSCTVELLNYRKDGSEFWNNLTISPVFDQRGELTHIIGVQTDVTERRRLEAQIRHAQKMEAVGQLAGGVAHDFNNLLTIINGYSEMLLHTTAPADPNRELLEEIRNAGERSAALTRQLLTFSRQQPLATQVLDLNQLVRGAERMLRRAAGENVQFTTKLQAGIAPVKADSGQLEQVLLNLTVNARDAMPDGGSLTIETREVDLDEADTRALPDVRPGAYVMLAVTDTGSGMTKEIQRRIFEPFFTTKAPGKGTGLGLAVTHGIIKQSNGSIEVCSHPAAGTTFKIYLPRWEEMAPASKATPAAIHDLRGSHTILIVEDEEGVRTLVRFLLKDRGYNVLEASHGEEALRIARQQLDPIHLLLSDVVMPGMGGRSVAEQLIALHPQMHVLYMSGYADDAVVRQGISHHQVNFLQKPFALKDLVDKVHAILTK